MFNKNKRIIGGIIAVFVFQLLFPQYSYAHELTSSEVGLKKSNKSMANLVQPIMFDAVKGASTDSVKMAEVGKAEEITAVNNQKTNDNQEYKVVKTVNVSMTAYSSTVDQCDDDPFTTAHGTKVRDGIVAANFLPFHTKVRIPELFGDKIFEVEDRMNSRYTNRVDIWMTTRQEALSFGVRRSVTIEVLE